MAESFPLSSITVGVQLQFFVGFRENIIARHNIPDNTTWLLQRQPPRDDSPPLVVLPMRRFLRQFDPFLADVVALEMGDSYAKSSYKLTACVDDDLNPYNFTLASKPDHVFYSGVACATPTKMCLNSTRYKPVLIDTLCSPPEQWLILASQADEPPLTGIDLQDIATDPAHPFNSLSWRAMEATSPMLDIHSLFVLCTPPTSTSIAWFRDTVARIRNSCLLHISPSCRPSFQIEFGRCREDADEAGTLLALKRLATMLFVGGEDTLRRAFVAPSRKSELVMLTESCSMRVRPCSAMTRLVVGQTAVLNPDAGRCAAPTRKRIYQNNLLDLGNVKFYQDNAEHFNGPPPPRRDLKARLEARAAAEEALQALDPDTSTQPRRVCYKDPARIAEYKRRGLDMDRVLADDIYMIWRCHTPDLLARLLSPHHVEEEEEEEEDGSTKHVRSIFDFGAWRNKERHRVKAQASTFPLAINVHLFAATMDPELLQSQLRLVCGLANRAVYGDAGRNQNNWQLPVYTFGRAHVESPVYPAVLSSAAIEAVSDRTTGNAAPVDNLDMDIFTGTHMALDNFGLDGYVAMPDIDLNADFSLDTSIDANLGANAYSFADTFTADHDLLETVPPLPVFPEFPGFPDFLQNHTDQVGILPLPQSLLDTIDAAADSTAQDPLHIPYDSWSEPAAAATGYLVWLGLTGDDITRLDAYTSNGMQSAEDEADDDGALRSFAR